MFNTIIWRYEEPVRGTHETRFHVHREHRQQLEKTIAWLQEHGDNGEYLAYPELGEWQDRASGDLPTADSGMIGLKAVLDEIRLQSRYEEDPTYYGPNPCPTIG